LNLLRRRDAEARHRHWQAKAAGTGTARVDKEYSLPVLNPWTVRVPRDDGPKTRGSRVQSKFVDVVQDIEGYASRFDDCGFR
jgi:hypothetical protein